MSREGRYTVKRGTRTFVVEPISKFAKKGADWGHKDLSNRPEQGAVHPDDSIITEDNGFKNIVTLGPGESPDSHIDKIYKNDSRTS